MRRLQPRVGVLPVVLAVLATVVALASAANVGRLRFESAVYTDDKGVGMREPRALACNDRSTLIVADTGRRRLLRYTIADRDAKPTAILEASQLSAPIRVQMTTAEDVYALDGKEHRIVRFDAKGAFKGYLEPEGVPGPGSIMPRSFRIDRNDDIYVLDVLSARVLVLDKNGKYQRHIPFPAVYGFFSDLAVDNLGVIYLLDSVNPGVYAAQKNASQFSLIAGDLRKDASFPTSIAVDKGRVLYIADQHSGGVVLLGQDGSFLGRQLSMGWANGFLYFPSDVCVTEKDLVFVADRGNSRVQIFSVLR